MNKKNKILILGLGAALILVAFYIGNAAWLSPISDTVSTSAPSLNADHHIKFTAVNTVPASGKIVITPEPGAFNIPTALNYQEVDFLVDSAQRDLAVWPSSTEDGVNVFSGSNGSITITLRNTQNIPAGSVVEIIIGDSASYGDNGDVGIDNPSSEGSYELAIETQNSSGEKIDGANTEIAIIDQINQGPLEFIDTTPPARFNGLPSGELPAGTTNVEISLETDDLSTCRYSLTAGTLYDDMTNNITTSSTRFHALDVATEDGQEYTYYIRCSNLHDYENLNDFTISFSVKETPVAGSEPGEEGGEDIPATGGTGSGSGEAYPPITASASFSGRAYPQSTITILKDAAKVLEGVATVNGGFDVRVSNLEKGVYTFTVYATDSSGNKSSNFNVTFTVNPNTNTTASGIFLSPSMELSSNEIEPGDTFTASGYSAPNSEVEVLLYKRGSSDSTATIYTADVSSQGTWSIDINTEELDADNYFIKAQSVLAGGVERSEFSNRLEIGIGAGVGGPILSADLNVDGSVNLIDFSILLFHWSTSGGDSDPPADINQNGRVELADFSIMLFQWTG